MSQEQETPREERSRLQHKAEHTRVKRGSVVWYLLILFIAAFLLLIMSYFMQQRANQEDLNDIRDSISAMDTLDQILAERDALKEENAALTAALEDARDTAGRAQESLTAAGGRVDALNKLNLIRKLYNQRRYSEARELLAGWEAAEPGGIAAALKAVSDSLGAGEREIYDPFAAWQQLTDWLG